MKKRTFAKKKFQSDVEVNKREEGVQKGVLHARFKRGSDEKRHPSPSIMSPKIAPFSSTTPPQRKMPRKLAAA